MIKQDERLEWTIRKMKQKLIPSGKRILLSNAFDEQIGKQYPLKLHGVIIGHSSLLSAVLNDDGSFDMEVELVTRE